MPARPIVYHIHPLLYVTCIDRFIVILSITVVHLRLRKASEMNVESNYTFSIL